MKIRRATPGEVGISPRAIGQFVDALEKDKLGVHSLMILRHGAVAAEAWWAPYAPEKTHSMYSLSKSFTSTAVGFAVQEGKIHLDDPVLSYFEDEFDLDPCGNMKKMTVRNLLTMGTGHERAPQRDPESWARSFLTSYVPREPGSLFMYNTPATYMLSCIVQKVTGQKVIDYLTPRLFEPLGIHDIWWEDSPQGINAGGTGLHLHTEDILRFGCFLLKRGMVDGKQLIDPAWIDMATSKQISNGDPAQPSDWTQGYGFQFWRCQPHNAFRGDGAFGQYCLVLPDQDAVIAITSGSTGIATILAHAWTYLLPAMGEPCADDGLEALRDRLSSLAIELPAGAAHRADEADLSGRYELGDGFFHALSFDFSGETPVLCIEDEEGRSVLPLGYGRWLPAAETPESRLSAYAWQADGTLLARIVLDHGPYIFDLKAKFVGSAVDAHYDANVSFGQKAFHLVGIKPQ